MSDGAHLGVGAARALETILGGRESPRPEEQATREAVLARILSAPTPGEGEITGEGGSAYEMAANAIAKGFWIVKHERHDIPLETDALWAAVKKKWPGFNDWLGGASGFQVGWATNCVRWLLECPPVQNPAILDVEAKGE